MNIVTGYTGSAHVTAAQAGAFNGAVCGLNNYVLSTGNKMSASMISNNTIRIYDGDLVINGRHATIPYGTWDELTIENGEAGKNRIDIVAAKYEKDASEGVEDISLVVIQGVSTASTPSAPDIPSGNVLEGDTPVYFPLYKITLSGINVTAPVALFSVLVPMASMQARMNTAENNINKINTSLGNIGGNAVINYQALTVAAAKSAYLSWGNNGSNSIATWGKGAVSIRLYPGTYLLLLKGACKTAKSAGKIELRSSTDMKTWNDVTYLAEWTASGDEEAFSVVQMYSVESSIYIALQVGNSGKADEALSSGQLTIVRLK